MLAYALARLARGFGWMLLFILIFALGMGGLAGGVYLVYRGFGQPGLFFAGLTIILFLLAWEFGEE